MRTQALGPSLVLICAAALAVACAPRVSVPDGERQRASRDLEGQRWFAQVALFVGKFYGDSSKLLVSDQPPEELDLLEAADGTPIAPPAPTRVILPGTPLQIRTVEFPTGMVIAGRIVMTPRYHPWVLLALEGEARPLVVVLPQTLTTADEVRAEIQRVLGPTDAATPFRSLPEPQRAAIARKEPTEAMGARAVEMAWGYPERKLIDRPAGTEEWTWPTDKRKAYFRDGRLLRWTIERR